MHKFEITLSVSLFVWLMFSDHLIFDLDLASNHAWYHDASSQAWAHMQKKIGSGAQGGFHSSEKTAPLLDQEHREDLIHQKRLLHYWIKSTGRVSFIRKDCSATQISCMPWFRLVSWSGLDCSPRGQKCLGPKMLSSIVCIKYAWIFLLAKKTTTKTGLITDFPIVFYQQWSMF